MRQENKALADEVVHLRRLVNLLEHDLHAAQCARPLHREGRRQWTRRPKPKEQR
jgi:hypothetical protein